MSSSHSHLVAFVQEGFMDVFKTHTLMELNPDEVLALLWTCKALYRSWREIIAHYAERKHLFCECCDDAIKPMDYNDDTERDLIWVHSYGVVQTEVHRRSDCPRRDSDSDSDSESESDSGSDSDSNYCASEPFASQSLTFCRDESTIYRSWKFVRLIPKKNSTKEWRVLCSEWECDECDAGDLNDFAFDCVQIYPLPPVNHRKAKRQRIQ